MAESNDVKDRFENVWKMRVLDDKFSVFSFDFQTADTDRIQLISFSIKEQYD